MIILKKQDGHLSFMYLNEGADKEDAIQQFKEQHPGYLEHIEMDIKLPHDREFRDAWELKDKKIVVNNSKAKDIHLTRIRRVRDMKLEELDKEQLRYLSESDKIKELENKKQILRDLPANWSSLDWPLNILGDK